MPREACDEILKRRDGCTGEKEDEARREIRERLQAGENPFEVIDEYGLEPDCRFDPVLSGGLPPRIPTGSGGQPFSCPDHPGGKEEKEHAA